jgi:hypothetical protein
LKEVKKIGIVLKATQNERDTQAKELKQLREENKELKIHKDKQSSVIAKYYGKFLVSEKEITKLKEYNTDIKYTNTCLVLEVDKLKERVKELEKVLKIILRDGESTESAIRFTVMTGHYYFNKLKQLLKEK